MQQINRLAGSAPGRSRAVSYGDLIFTVATAEQGGESVTEQTRRSLQIIDRNLADAGSDKSRILSATVYLTDITHKAEMDKVWCDWIGPQANWPQRACVQVVLAPRTLVEISIVAATL